MPAFGRISKERLRSVHPLLIKCAYTVVKVFDISIAMGVRTTEEQQALYAIGRTSELDRSPVTNCDGINKKSKHQIREDGLCHAIDVNPYPVDFNNKERYYLMWGLFLGVSQSILDHSDYKLRWGGDWDGDNEFDDQTFIDLPHIELIKK